MESRPFHICPFCQSPSPASVSRCGHCHRSLAGLPLPVYGSDPDAGLARPASQEPLLDLPLRASPPREGEAVTAPMAGPPSVTTRRALGARPRGVRATIRGRVGRGTKMAVGTVVIALALVGGWLVRAQDRPPQSVRPAEGRKAVRAAASVASATAVRAAATVPPARHERTAPPVRAASPSPSPVEKPRAEVYTVHPDVASPPDASAVARRPPAAEPIDAAQAEVLFRFRRAFQRRDALAERVARLRARLDAPVVTDVQEYERTQEELAATQEQLDQAQADVARLRRTLTE